MAQKDTSVSDFKVAPRKPRPETPTEPATNVEQAKAVEESVPEPAPQTERPQSRPDLPMPTSRAGKLLSTDEETRRERAESRALRQEDSRLRLQDLKQTKARESKHFVNCPLNYDTKQRLMRAATENNVKMTKIIQTAIDHYLRDNGY